MLGHDPSRHIIGVSYGADLAVKLGNDFRAIVESEWYRPLFPQMQLSRFKNTELEVLTSRYGYRLGTSIDGTLTGRGGDIIIIDDPLKPADALSASRREYANEWFFNTLLSRLDDKVNGAIVVVMQRLHADDLSGTLLRSGENWILLSLPAIAEFEQMIPISPNSFISAASEMSCIRSGNRGLRWSGSAFNSAPTSSPRNISNARCPPKAR